MTGRPRREHLGHDRAGRLVAGEVDAAHDHPRGVTGVQVVADGVHRDEDRQRPAGRVGEAQLGEQPLRLAEGLAGAVDVGEPAEHRAHAGGVGEPLHGILHRELGPAVGDERARRGALVERRRDAARRTGRRPTTRGRRRRPHPPARMPRARRSRARRRAPRRPGPPRRWRRRPAPAHQASAHGRPARAAAKRPTSVDEGAHAGLLVGPGHRRGEHLVPRGGELGHDVPADEPPGPDDPGEGSRAGRGHARSRPSGPSRRSRTGR